jgi:hypothetical protein
MFAQSKTVLSKIETEMIADGLYYAAKNRRLRHGEPELTDAQLSKYEDLFGRLPYNSAIFRDDGSTSVTLPSASPMGLGKDFNFWFVHREISDGLPACDAGGRTVSCGGCDVDLGDDWHLLYQWLPKDIGPDWDGRIGEGLPTMEEIQELHQREVKECLEMGWKEMGVAPDTK